MKTLTNTNSVILPIDQVHLQFDQRIVRRVKPIQFSCHGIHSVQKHADQLDSGKFSSFCECKCVRKTNTNFLAENRKRDNTTCGTRLMRRRADTSRKLYSRCSRAKTKTLWRTPVSVLRSLQPLKCPTASGTTFCSWCRNIRRRKICSTGSRRFRL